MTATALLLSVLLSSLGLGFFIYGKKQGAAVPLVCGIALMVFPYFVPNTWLMLILGAVLAVVPFVVKV